MTIQTQPALETDTETQVETTAAENTETEVASQPEAEPATDENKIICRRTQVIGSRFTKRICGTQDEWDELARKGQISTAEFQAKGAGIRQAGN
ncbi:MAG: hypothetical protein HKP43_06365 [Altererythrobacter sp.]|nr:hypothetical protein [Altererythrobacter sp.]NNK46231.1 hypothetical protein [Altererythrobacter sp.]